MEDVSNDGLELVSNDGGTEVKSDNNENLITGDDEISLHEIVYFRFA